MNDFNDFNERNQKAIAAMSKDNALCNKTRSWFNTSFGHEYSYHFRWMGVPIIQYPQDIVAMQEIVWEVKPDLIIETGIARGGSLIFYASLMQLLGQGHVLGIDMDIRQHNRDVIESHPMASRITMYQGSSIEESMATKVRAFASDYRRVMLVLDSNHTHEHVLRELELYAPLVAVDSYCVVFDTVVEDMPNSSFSNRPWGRGNNPKTAVWKYLKTHPEFQIDKNIATKLQITVAPDGYLKRIR